MKESCAKGCGRRSINGFWDVGVRSTLGGGCSLLLLLHVGFDLEVVDAKECIIRC